MAAKKFITVIHNGTEYSIDHINEKIWSVTFKESGGPSYMITSKGEFIRDVYYIYSIDDDGHIKKLGKGPNPSELEQKYT